MIQPLLIPIFNRSVDGSFELPKDSWYQIAPYGEYPHKQSGTVQIIDKQAAESMSNAFSKEMPNGQPGLLIDYEHYAHQEDGSTEAAGWIEGLQARDDGLYANIRWSEAGLEAVKGGRYRFISPTWFREECDQLQGNKLRPLRLNDAALTNLPNLRGMKPLSDKGGHTNKGASPQDKEDEMRDKLIPLLGLPAEATEEVVLSAISALQNRDSTAGDAIKALKDKVESLENSNKTMLASLVESDLAKYSSRIKDDSRQKVKEQLLANREATLLMLESIAEVTPTTPAPMHNRDATTPPAASPTDPKTMFENVVKEELKNNNNNKSSAISNAIKKAPDIYKAWRESGSGTLNI